MRFTEVKNLGGDGEGPTAAVASTQGGVLTRLPWATIGDPFRVENWLRVKFSGTPCIQENDDRTLRGDFIPELFTAVHGGS